MINKNFNSQIVAYSKTVVKNENRPHSCPRCGSKNLKGGAGLKPGEESQRCSDCGEFLEYLPIKPLKKLRKRRKLTDSLNLLEAHGIKSEAAQLLLLSAVGGES
jgi:transposase-like protein